MLIDDDESTNFLHKLVIDEECCTDHVVVFESAEKALVYLTEAFENTEANYIRPDLIFLDINMPRMNGWEFIEEYQKLPEDKRSRIVIMMLTTSLFPDDQEKAKTTKEVDGFYNKPLTPEIIEEVLRNHFVDHL